MESYLSRRTKILKELRAAQQAHDTDMIESLQEDLKDLDREVKQEDTPKPTQGQLFDP